MGIKHILVDMDPMNEQQPALLKAISIAKRFNASILSLSPPTPI